MEHVIFSLVQDDGLREAYGWHKGYAAANHHILAKTWPQYESIVASGHMWIAKDGKGEIHAMAYAVLDGETWEIGGLMVAVQEGRRGIGTAIIFITLGHLLFEENPLADRKRVIAHAHAQNEKPLKLIEELLRFEKTQDVKIPKDMLPGLLADPDGFIRGSEFSLRIPDTLKALAEWSSTWKGCLNDGTRASVDLRDGITFDMWAEAFLSMQSA